VQERCEKSRHADGVKTFSAHSKPGIYFRSNPSELYAGACSAGNPPSGPVACLSGMEAEEHVSILGKPLVWRA